MKTEELRRIFRFRARIDALTREISQAETTLGIVKDPVEVARLRVERAALNLAAMRSMAVCVDLRANDIVVPENLTGREHWLARLYEALDIENGVLLEIVLQG